MVKKTYSYFYFFTSINPCDSSPPLRRNHEPETPKKFSKHGFSFFNPNIPLSLKNQTKWKIGCLFHDNPHLSSKNPFWQKSKKISKLKCKKTQLSLSKLSFDKKYWLNFLELPFSRRNRRPKIRTDLPHKSFFPLTGYLASVCIRPEQIPRPESKIISLPRAASILAHLCLTMTLQHLELH